MSRSIQHRVSSLIWKLYRLNTFLFIEKCPLLDQCKGQLFGVRSYSIPHYWFSDFFIIKAREWALNRSLSN